MMNLRKMISGDYTEKKYKKKSLFAIEITASNPI